MAKIFAYTKDQKISKPILAALLEAGYIAIPVDSFDCVMVIEPIPDIPLAEASIIFTAAIETIREHQEYGMGKPREEFAKKVLRMVSDKLNPKAPEVSNSGKRTPEA